MNDDDARAYRATGLALLWGALVALLATWNVSAAAGFDFLPWGDDRNITLAPERPPIFALLHAIAGSSPVGYHLFNVGLHGANALLLFALILRLLRHWRATEDDRWIVSAAGIGTLLWALHPMRAATIGWASALPVGLATLLALAAIHVGWSERGWRHARVFVAALLAVPALLLLPLPGAEMNVVWPDAAEFDDLGVFARGLRGVGAIGGYLVKTLWPFSLSPAPTTWLAYAVGDWRGWTSLVGLGVVTWAIWRRPRWRLLWLAFIALLLPGLGWMLQHYFSCDHYVEVATLALGLAAALGLTYLKPGPWRDWGGLVVLGVVVAFAIAQRFALATWQDADALFDRIASEANEREFHAATYRRWARFHIARGESNDTQEVLLRATRVGVSPEKVFAVLDEAANARRGARPQLAQRHEELAAVADNRGRLDDAREHLVAALALAPDSSRTRLTLAMIYMGEGDLDLALHLYLRATANPEATTAAERFWLERPLAQALHRAGRMQLAWRVSERALRDAPSPVDPALREEFERYRRAALKPSLG